MDSAAFVPPSHWPELEHRVTDIHGDRLREMDALRERPRRKQRHPQPPPQRPKSGP